MSAPIVALDAETRYQQLHDELAGDLAQLAARIAGLIQRSEQLRHEHERMLTRQSDRLVDVDEAAGLLHCSASEVYRMTQRGVLPRVRIGKGAVKVSLAAIEVFIAAGGER